MKISFCLYLYLAKVELNFTTFNKMWYMGQKCDITPVFVTKIDYLWLKNIFCIFVTSKLWQDNEPDSFSIQKIHTAASSCDCAAYILFYLYSRTASEHFCYAFRQWMVWCTPYDNVLYYSTLYDANKIVLLSCAHLLELYAVYILVSCWDNIHVLLSLALSLACNG